MNVQSGGIASTVDVDSDGAGDSDGGDDGGGEWEHENTACRGQPVLTTLEADEANLAIRRAIRWRASRRPAMTL